MFALAGPLYLLFELGVVLSYWVTRSRRKRAFEEELEARRASEALDAIPREPRRLGVDV